MRNALLTATLLFVLTTVLPAQEVFTGWRVGIGGSSYSGYGLLLENPLGKATVLRVSGSGYVFENYGNYIRNEMLNVGFQLQRTFIRLEQGSGSQLRGYFHLGGGLFQNRRTRIITETQELGLRLSGNKSFRPGVGVGFEIKSGKSVNLAIEGTYQGIYRPEFDRVTYIGFGAGAVVTFKL